MNKVPLKRTTANYFQNMCLRDDNSPLRYAYYKMGSLYASDTIVLAKMTWAEPVLMTGKTYILDTSKYGKMNHNSALDLKKVLVPTDLEMPNFDLWFQNREKENISAKAYIDSTVFDQVVGMFANTETEINVIENSEDSLYLSGISFRFHKKYSQLELIIAKKWIDWDV